MDESGSKRDRTKTTTRNIDILESVFSVGDRISFVDASKTNYTGVVEEIGKSQYVIQWDSDATISELGFSSSYKMKLLTK